MSLQPFDGVEGPAASVVRVSLKQLGRLTVVDEGDSHPDEGMATLRATQIAWVLGRALGLALLMTSATGVALSQEPDPAGAEAVDRVPVALVLDASGSMWGRLDGEVKMDIARNVVRELVTAWGDRIDLGVVAYGHRRQGDCTDIETLVVPGEGSSAAVLGAVDGISAKGKTPLASAIEQAAASVGYRDRRAIVTVVSDGRETCGLDPCAVASRLAADGQDFTTHVIGFDMTEAEGKELRCIASATGGLFARATSRAELVTALGRVLTRAVAATGPSRLVLSAAAGETDQPILEGVRWTVTPLDASSDANAGPITIEGTAEPIELAPGRYDLRAEHAGTTIERQIELRPGETWREHVRFGKGQLALRAVLSEGATPIAEPVHWSIYPIRAFGRIAAEPIHEQTKATSLVRVEAGHYEVRARYGDAEQRIRVEARAGVIQPHTVDLEAGVARVFASLPPPGGPFLEPVEWTVRPLDAQGDRQDPIVERRVTNQSFILPIGRYHITARHGELIGDAIVRVLGGQSEAVGLVLHGSAPASGPDSRRRR